MTAWLGGWGGGGGDSTVGMVEAECCGPSSAGRYGCSMAGRRGWAACVFVDALVRDAGWCQGHTCPLCGAEGPGLVLMDGVCVWGGVSLVDVCVLTRRREVDACMLTCRRGCALCCYLFLSHPRLHVAEDTPVPAIEDAFKRFTEREDIAIVLINQYVRGYPVARLGGCPTQLLPAATFSVSGSRRCP